MGEMTLFNWIPDLVNVTFQITSGNEQVTELTVPSQGSVEHPTDDTAAPWVIVTMVSSLDPNGPIYNIGSLVVNDPNASILADLTTLSTPEAALPKVAVADSTLQSSRFWETQGRTLELGNGIERFLMQQQQQTLWCWAAVTSSIQQFYYGTGQTQCELANHFFSQTSCCTDGTTAQCNRCYDVATALQYANVLVRSEGGPVSMDVIRNEIDNQRPLGVGVAWATSGAHAMAIAGYYQILGDQLLLITDPWYGDSVIFYSQFPASYFGGGSWFESWLTGSNSDARRHSC